MQCGKRGRSLKIVLGYDLRALRSIDIEQGAVIDDHLGPFRRVGRRACRICTQ